MVKLRLDLNVYIYLYIYETLCPTITLINKTNLFWEDIKSTKTFWKCSKVQKKSNLFCRQVPYHEKNLSVF